MKNLAVVTDSASGLTPGMKQENSITVVPIWVQIGDAAYRDGVDLSAKEFYEKLDGPTMPTTSSPPPNEFLQVYRLLSKTVKEIISIHVTADGSATCQAAAVAAEAVPEVDVTVYDSKAASMGVGFLAMEAAKAAAAGLNKEEILARLDSLRSRIYMFGAIPTLKYLRRSGRVRKGQAALASLLSIKPVIEIKGGMVKIVDHVRTFSRALSRVADLAAEAVGSLPAVVSVVHANALEEAENFSALIKQRINVKELHISEIGPALAIHGGPGMIGIVLYAISR